MERTSLLFITVSAIKIRNKVKAKYLLRYFIAKRTPNKQYCFVMNKFLLQYHLSNPPILKYFMKLGFDKYWIRKNEPFHKTKEHL